MIEAQRHQQQPTEVPVTSDSLRRLQQALEAQIVAAGAAGVLQFNGRSGNVSLSSADVTGALGYAPADTDIFTGAASGLVPASGGGTSNFLRADGSFAPPPSGGGVAEGTSFPGSPAAGDKFYRTDRKFQYEYDGTRWLTSDLFSLNQNILGVSTDTISYAAIPFSHLYGIWLESFDTALYRSAVSEWDVVLGYRNSAHVQTTILTVDGSAETAVGWFDHTTAIGALLNTNARSIEVLVDEISGSALAYLGWTLWYRLVG